MLSNYEVSLQGKVLKKVQANSVKDAVMRALATGLLGCDFRQLTAEKVL